MAETGNESKKPSRFTILARVVESGKWSELTDAERALFVVYVTCANSESLGSFHNKVDLAAMAGLSVRTVQQAKASLIAKQLIDSDWDGNFTHAATVKLSTNVLETKRRDFKGERLARHHALAHQTARG